MITKISKQCKQDIKFEEKDKNTLFYALLSVIFPDLKPNEPWSGNC